MCVCVCACVRESEGVRVGSGACVGLLFFEALETFSAVTLRPCCVLIPACVQLQVSDPGSFRCSRSPLSRPRVSSVPSRLPPSDFGTFPSGSRFLALCAACPLLCQANKRLLSTSPCWRQEWMEACVTALRLCEHQPSTYHHTLPHTHTYSRPRQEENRL